jgi:L-fucose isomerase-like protein
LFTRPITGWSFMNGAQWIQSGAKADMVASSNFEDLVPLFPMLRTIHHLKHSKVLVINTSRSGGKEFTAQFGTEMAYPAYADLKAAFESADLRKAEKEGAELAAKALKIVEPSSSDIRDAWRLYLGVRALLEKEKANAITIDCLGGFRRGDLPAYPCVAWSTLNDQGLYGVCESDIQSTMTQLLLTSYSGKPGFVSDPTFDTGRNEVIHAHCVAATRMRGFGGPPSPFTLRSHMEDNKGVSVEVEMPVRETITCAVLNGPKTLLASTGEVTANVDSPRGCRTKIVTRVADARKMVEGWTGGLHRVLFYGDHMEAAERMGRLMGFRVRREC